MTSKSDYRTRKLTDEEMARAIETFARERGYNVDAVVTTTALRLAATCNYRKHLEDCPK